MDVVSSVTLGQAVSWVLAVAGGIITLSKLADIIKEHRKPAKDLKTRVDEVDRKLATDKARLDALDKGNGVIFRGIYALINHELSGNGNDILRKSRDEIQQYLTDR